MRRVLMLAAFLIAAACMPGPAQACSVVSEYVRPSNYELVELADAIVVATAVRGIESDDEFGVIFRVDEAIKGEPPETVTHAMGYLGLAEAGDPTELIEPHPESFIGPCTRFTFTPDHRYVLFLKRVTMSDGEVGWMVEGYPFTRVSEDYLGPESLWVRTIRNHLEVQRSHNRVAALDALATRLAAMDSEQATPEDRAVALDLLNHLSSISPFKPTAYLINAYEAMERGEAPPFSLRVMAEDARYPIIQAVLNRVPHTPPPPYEPDPERERRHVLAMLVNGDHPDAAPLFERLLTDEPSLADLSMIIRFMARNGQLRRAFGVVETEVMHRLGAAPDYDAYELVAAVRNAMHGRYLVDEYEEPWRDDPYMRARWPELSLSLYWDMQRRGDGERGLMAELAELRPDDYHNRPEVTVALAATLDEAVRDWAISELGRLAPQADWLDDNDPLWLPMRVLVVSFGEQRDRALERAFCYGGSPQMMLMQSLAIWSRPYSSDLLTRMLVSPDLSEDDLEQVRRAHAVAYGRQVRNPSQWFDRGAYRRLQASFDGSHIDAEPIRCPG